MATRREMLTPEQRGPIVDREQQLTRMANLLVDAVDLSGKSGRNGASLEPRVSIGAAIMARGDRARRAGDGRPTAAQNTVGLQ